MAEATGTATAVGVLATMNAPQGGFVTYVFTGTWDATILLEYSGNGGITWSVLDSFSANVSDRKNTLAVGAYRLRVSEFTSGTVVWGMTANSMTTFEPGVVWEDLRFPAQGINPPGTIRDPDVDQTLDGFPGTLLFQHDRIEMIAGVAQMSHAWQEGTGIRPHIHWSKTTSDPGDVAWVFAYRFLERGVAPENWSSDIAGEVVLPTNDIEEAEGITAFGEITMTDRKASQMMSWRVSRLGGEPQDTYADHDARLFEFDIHYRRDSDGTGGEFIK